jgi:uncharacterized protein YcnI
VRTVPVSLYVKEDVRIKEYTNKMGWKVFAKQKEKVLSTSSKGILIISIR